MIETNFDYSMLRAFHNCRRRYYYQYVMSVIPVQNSPNILPGPMEFGSAIDAGLDMAYQILALNPNQQEKLFKECFQDAEYRSHRMFTIAHYAARNTFKEEWKGVVNKGYSEQLGLDLLDEYFSRYFPEKFDTIDSQISGAVPIEAWGGYEVNFMIKADRLVWGYDPNYYSIFEVKTTSNPNDVWWFGQEMSRQIDGYVMGVESYTGHNIHSVVIDCLGTKIKKGRLQRRPIIMSALRRKTYYQWLTESVNQIMQLQDELMSVYGHLGEYACEVCQKALQVGGKPHHHWIENRDNCTHFYRQCEYASLCDSDCHPGALANYEVSKWRPYMRKGGLL